MIRWAEEDDAIHAMNDESSSLNKEVSLGTALGSLGPRCHCSERAAGSVLIFPHEGTIEQSILGFFHCGGVKCSMLLGMIKEKQRGSLQSVIQAQWQQRGTFSTAVQRRICWLWHQAFFLREMNSSFQSPWSNLYVFLKANITPPKLYCVLYAAPSNSWYPGVPGSSCKGCVSPSERNAIDNRTTTVFYNGFFKV